MLISVSFLKNKDGNYETINKLNNTSCDYIHIDIMDGKFTKNKNFEYKEIEELFKDNKKRLDVHLMVEDAYSYIEDYIKLKPDFITFHIESKSDINKCIKLVKDNNIKVGLAINPDTRVYNILPYINDIDLVLVMSVVPGEGGQEFIKDVVKKINELKALQRKYKYVINVDGGINNETIKLVNSDMIVSGSYITMSDNFNENINKLKEQI
ncbi:MAG: ribulose-phosphate 3-epimerase [Firmicutes bacterium]|nr:ribulose-phosphate 3-epimerase [Bacillota bacterium]